MQDDLLFSRCIDDLSKLGIDTNERVIDYFSTVEKHAYPIYHLDYKHHLNNLLSWIDSIENIHTCGRNRLFRYIFMDRAMEMGFEAAMIVEREKEQKSMNESGQ
jgi:protoporphyrinogen oxidase